MHKSFLLLVLFFLLTTSCKKDKKDAIPHPLEGRTLTAKEVKIARLICTSFREKKNYFYTLSRGSASGRFQFTPSIQECGGNLTKKPEVTVALNNSSWQFNPTPSNSYFMSDILTDEHGPLKDFCHEILDRGAGTELTNIIKEGQRQFVYSFYFRGKPAFEILTYIYQNNTWKQFFVDYYEVINDSSSKKYGMISMRVNNSSCTPKVGIKINKQVLL